MFLDWPGDLLKPLRSISPSRFISASQCALREVMSANAVAPALPMSPGHYIGTITHRMFREAGEGNLGADVSLIERRWLSMIDDVEQCIARNPSEAWLVPVSAVLPDYEVRRIQTVRRAFQLALSTRRSGNVVPPSGPRKYGFELSVATPDGAVRGKIDRVLRSPRGRPIIQDYKTGNIYDARGTSRKMVRAEYEGQLRLYAALYYEVYHVWPETLELVPLQGESIEIPFDRVACVSLLEAARSMLANLNSVIALGITAESSERLATPQPRACRFCNYRPLCGAYQKKIALRPALHNSDWPNDVIGRVTAVQQLGNGTISVEVEQAEQRTRIRGVSSDPERQPYAQGLAVGLKIGVFNLYTPTLGGTPTQGPYSMVYVRKTPDA